MQGDPLNTKNSHRRLRAQFYYVTSLLKLYSLSSVNERWLNRYGNGLCAGRPGFDSLQGQETFLHSVQTGSEAHQSPNLWAHRALSPGVKCLGHETDHSKPYSAEVKNGVAIPPLPHTLPV
jgi:hypothetical protein